MQIRYFTYLQKSCKIALFMCFWKLGAICLYSLMQFILYSRWMCCIRSNLKHSTFPWSSLLGRLIFHLVMLLLGQEKEVSGQAEALLLEVCVLCVPQFALGHPGLAILNSVNCQSSKGLQVNCSFFHYLRADTLQFQIIASIYRAWSQKHFKCFIKLLS